MTTYVDEIEVRRPSVGTKVLVLACAILAILGSFWGIVWFIRSYVEPPRVMAPAPLILAARESTPAPAPAGPPPETAAPVPAASSPAGSTPVPLVSEAQAAPATRPAAQPPASRDASPPSASDAVADRWAPMSQFNAPVQATPAPPPAPAAEQAEPATAAATPERPESDMEEVAESSVPAIEGRAPLPRRRPIVTASRRLDPPLPRPRPEAAGGQPSVWTAVPSADDRYQAGQ